MACQRGLWAGPLAQSLGADGAAVGWVTLVMGLAMVRGNSAYSPADRIFGTRKGVIWGRNAVVLLALFGQMERTYSLERAAGARAAAEAKGRRTGRPTVVDPDKLAYAAHLRDTDHTIAQIVEKTGITRTTLYRHLPKAPAEAHLADAPDTLSQANASTDRR